MIRHDFSYCLELTGTPESLAAADSTLCSLGVVPDYLLPDIDSTEPDIARYIVDPDAGTIEEWSSAAETIGELAEKHPDLQIILDCTDEEDHVCSSKHVWYQGKHAEAYGVIYLPEDDLLLLKATKGESAFIYERTLRILRSMTRGVQPDIQAILQEAIAKLGKIATLDGVSGS